MTDQSIVSNLQAYGKEFVMVYGDAYALNDRAHRKEHFEEVLANCLTMCNKSGRVISHRDGMMFVAAAYLHDLFAWSRHNHHLLAETHVLTSNCSLLGRLTTDERKVVATMCAQHRASYRGEFANEMAWIFNCADSGFPSLEADVRRAYISAKEHSPAGTPITWASATITHMLEKFGRHGYMRRSAGYVTLVGQDVLDVYFDHIDMLTPNAVIDMSEDATLVKNDNTPLEAVGVETKDEEKGSIDQALFDKLLNDSELYQAILARYPVRTMTVPREDCDCQYGPPVGSMVSGAGQRAESVDLSESTDKSHLAKRQLHHIMKLQQILSHIYVMPSSVPDEISSQIEKSLYVDLRYSPSRIVKFIYMVCSNYGTVLQKHDSTLSTLMNHGGGRDIAVEIRRLIHLELSENVDPRLRRVSTIEEYLGAILKILDRFKVHPAVIAHLCMFHSR